MIEGIKVTITGTELRDLCLARAEHHVNRQNAYTQQLESMKFNQIEGMSYTNGDPIKSLEDKRLEHANAGAEMLFISKHLKPDEEYLLDRNDLFRLGITKSKY